MVRAAGRVGYRVLIWLDATLGPDDKAWIEAYNGSDRLYARSVDCEPFDTADEVLAACLSAIGRLGAQTALPFNDQG